MSVSVQSSVEIMAEPERVWAAVVDWRRHARWVPLTSMRVLTPSGQGVGARFVGRSALGPFGFDDVMEVTSWQPPRPGGTARVDVVKQGKVVTGSAWFEVAEVAGTSRTRLTWAEDVGFAGLPLGSVPSRLLAPVVRAGLTMVLRRIAREVEAEADAARSAK